MEEKYIKFLESKRKTINDCGFMPHALNHNLFDFQRHIVEKALKMGKYAIFADCGLGKTLMQIEWANQVSIHTGKPVLILAPLAVSGQTIQEGEKFGIKVIRISDVENPYTTGFGGIWITNYEQLPKIDVRCYAGIVLDESSILKNFTGKYKSLIIDVFANTPYKLACTATPSPNDVMEIGNHAEFLNVMTRNEMLSMYFFHDGGETSKWALKGHAINDFWRWVSQWAVMFSNPSDIGFDNKGYCLPLLKLIEKEIKTTRRKNGKLFNDTAVSAIDFNSELRITKINRMSEIAKIVNESSENFIVWIKQNEEADVLKKLIPDAIEVRGSELPEKKEEKLLGFANNKFKVLITKTKIAQFGLNYQNCRNQIFASLDFSFESLYQAIRRCYRYGQKHEVNIWIITTDTMQNVIKSIKEKQRQFEMMQKEMTGNINKFLDTSTAVEIDAPQKVETSNYTIKRGDCVKLIEDLADKSIGFSIFSPPFASLYTYSDNIEDMGNSKDYNEFLYAFNFLVVQLRRVLMPGRNVAVHCMDLPIQKGKEGYIGLRDFSNMIRECFEKNGFIYHSRVTIWKNPVTEMLRTKALGLLHKQIKKDSAMCRVGLPDYLLIFRNMGDNIHPIKCDIDVNTWQEWASPVWMDINYSNTLNKNNARDEKDEKHICPLQLETIERAIQLWSNKDDTILSPFMGIGSEGYVATKLGRKFIGFELKQSYFDEAVKNMKAIELLNRQKSLFKEDVNCQR